MARHLRRRPVCVYHRRLKAWCDIYTFAEQPWKLGNTLLKEAVEVVVSPVQPLADQLREWAPGQVPPVDLRSVVHRFFIERRFTDYHDTVASRLARI